MENAYKKLIKDLKLIFFLSTDMISFFVITPLIVLYAMVNLELTRSQTEIFVIFAAVTVVFSLVSSPIANRIEISPVIDYLKKASSGEEITADLIERAQKRFFTLPYIHSISSSIKWVVGLSIVAVPLTLFGGLSPVQAYNIWMLMVIMPMFTMVFYFFLIEIFIQKILNRGIFDHIALDRIGLRINFLLRILLSITVIVAIPIITITGFFLQNMPQDRLGPSFYSKLTCIIAFGITAALGLAMSLTRTIRDKIGIIVDFVNKVGTGDLATHKHIIAVMDDLTMINQTIYVMKKNITEMINEIRDISYQLKASTDQISTITESFSGNTQNQAATVEEVTSTIDEISAGMDGIARGAQEQYGSMSSLISEMEVLSSTIKDMEARISEGLSLADVISEQARQGENFLSQMSGSMKKISGSSEQMTGIIGIINDISDKINLLSLNASIEAARAGDAGRGFAVVADEISKLADSTALSVKEIDSLIKSSESEIGKGITSVSLVVTSISKITSGVESINAMMNGISEFVRRQVDTNRIVNQESERVRIKSEEIEHATIEEKTAVGEVVSSVTRINDLTQQISSGAEEIASYTGMIAGMADILKNKVDQFRIK